MAEASASSPSAQAAVAVTTAPAMNGARHRPSPHGSRPTPLGAPDQIALSHEYGRPSTATSAGSTPIPSRTAPDNPAAAAPAINPLRTPCPELSSASATSTSPTPP